MEKLQSLLLVLRRVELNRDGKRLLSDVRLAIAKEWTADVPSLLERAVALRIVRNAEGISL